MANAYSSPERTALHMQHLDENHDRIMQLRDEMSNPNTSMVNVVMAFTELYELHDGDPYAQRRLMLNLRFAAKRHNETH